MQVDAYAASLKHQLALLPANTTGTPCLDHGYDVFLETMQGGSAGAQDLYTKEQ